MLLFVALETSREVAVVDAHNGGNCSDSTSVARRRAWRSRPTAAGCTSAISWTARSASTTYEAGGEGQWEVPLVTTLQSVATEKLDATVLKGKQFFYDARDTRLAREGYMSCASCHNDGGPTAGPGTSPAWAKACATRSPCAAVPAAQGFLHWSGNFDEVQDFEGQIRSFAAARGSCLTQTSTGTRSQPLGDPKAGLSADLDALAAYVASLERVRCQPLPQRRRRR